MTFAAACLAVSAKSAADVASSIAFASSRVSRTLWESHSAAVEGTWREPLRLLLLLLLLLLLPSLGSPRSPLCSLRRAIA